MVNIEDNYYHFRRLAGIKLGVEYNTPSAYNIFIKDAVIARNPFFNNVMKVWFDESSLPVSCTNISDLSNKFVLYGAYTNGETFRFYIGQTGDIGERITTHLKDIRKVNTLAEARTFHKEARKTGECIIFILGVFDTEEELKMAEHTMIAFNKDYSIEQSCKSKEHYQFVQEMKNTTKSIYKDYTNAHCMNIID